MIKKHGNLNERGIKINKKIMSGYIRKTVKQRETIYIKNTVLNQVYEEVLVENEREAKFINRMLTEARVN